jgi:hypothetical protein
MEAGMTSSSLPINSRRKQLISVIALMAASCAVAQVEKRSTMDIQSFNLWQLLEALGDQPSLAPDRSSRSVAVDFVENKRNRYFAFHQGGQLRLAEQVEIKSVQLRTSLADDRNGLVILELAGACLPIDEVRAHYPEVKISAAPQGHSLDERTSYSTQQPWGRLSFEFKQRNQKCVAAVVIDRTAAAPNG